MVISHINSSPLPTDTSFTSKYESSLLLNKEFNHGASEISFGELFHSVVIRLRRKTWSMPVSSRLLLTREFELMSSPQSYSDLAFFFDAVNNFVDLDEFSSLSLSRLLLNSVQPSLASLSSYGSKSLVFLFKNFPKFFLHWFKVCLYWFLVPLIGHSFPYFEIVSSIPKTEVLIGIDLKSFEEANHETDEDLYSDER